MFYFSIYSFKTNLPVVISHGSTILLTSEFNHSRSYKILKDIISLLLGLSIEFRNTYHSFP
jgi:hypothetical protein